jgi:hypothetical protein
MEADFEEMMNELRKTEPVLERLRGIPIEQWRLSDLDEEIEAHGRLREEQNRRLETRAFLLGLVDELDKRHPGKTMAELIQLLPLPEREMAMEMVSARTPWEKLPLEQVNRQPWHDRVEKALRERIQGSRPQTCCRTRVFDSPVIENFGPQRTGTWRNCSTRQR